MDPSAISTHLDFEDRRVFRTRKRGKGQATVRTLPFVLWEVKELLAHGQLGVIAALVALGVWLLAPRTAFRRLRDCGRGGRRLGREGRQSSGASRGFGLAAEELLFALSQESLEMIDLVLEVALTRESAFVLSLPVGSLLTENVGLTRMRAVRVGTGRQDRRRRYRTLVGSLDAVCC
jgi:hypothetical protein